MAEIEKEPRCWGCGNTQTACDCEDGFIALVVTPPTQIMPVCGSRTIYIEAPWNDPKRYIEVLPRPCCICGKDWEATYHQHEHGVCPHCGAHGADGIGGKS